MPHLRQEQTKHGYCRLCMIPSLFHWINRNFSYLDLWLSNALQETLRPTASLQWAACDKHGCNVKAPNMSGGSICFPFWTKLAVVLSRDIGKYHGTSQWRVRDTSRKCSSCRWCHHFLAKTFAQYPWRQYQQASWQNIMPLLGFRIQNCFKGINQLLDFFLLP